MIATKYLVSADRYDYIKISIIYLVGQVLILEIAGQRQLQFKLAAHGPTSPIWCAFNQS